MIIEAGPRNLASIMIPLGFLAITACQTQGRYPAAEDFGAAGERPIDQKVSATIGDDLSGVIAKDDIPSSLSSAEEREKPWVSATIGDDLSGTIAKKDKRATRDRPGEGQEADETPIAAQEGADDAASEGAEGRDRQSPPVAIGAVGERTECGLTIVATSADAVADPCSTTTDFMRTLGYNDAQISSILAIDAGRAVAH